MGIMEAGKSHDKPPSSWRTRKADIQFSLGLKSWEPKSRETGDTGISLRILS
jgi:hypothetical protein